MSSISLNLNNSLIKGVEDSCKSYTREAIEWCGVRYNFNASEAIELLGLMNMTTKLCDKGEKVLEKVMKPRFALPYNGEHNEELCSALSLNGGLYTQCQGKKMSSSEYCKGCLNQMQKSGQEIPEYGTIRMRKECDLFSYVDPKGRKQVAYKKIMNKLKLSREDVLSEAEKFGIKVLEEHFTMEEEKAKRGRPATKKDEDKEKNPKGRPKKVDTEVELSGDVDDIFASLVRANQSQVAEVPVLEVNIEADMKAEKEAKLAAEKAEKEAKLAAEKAEKEAKLAAEKAEKEAKLAAEKAEKEAKLAAEKEAKEKQAAEKAEKEAREKREKEERAAMLKAEKESKEAEKQAKAAADKLAKEQKAAADKLAKEQKAAADKAAKEAKAAADKAAKEAKIAADKAAKEAAKKAKAEADKLAKEAAKKAKAEADKLAKEEAKKSKEATKEEDKKREAELNAYAKETAKQLKAAEMVSKELVAEELVAEVLETKNIFESSDEEEEEDVVKRIEYEGKQYLRSVNTGTIYNMEQEEVGKWNDENGKIDFLEEEEVTDVVKKFEYEGKLYLKSMTTGIIYDYDEQEPIGKWNDANGKIDFDSSDDEEYEE